MAKPQDNGKGGNSQAFARSTIVSYDTDFSYAVGGNAPVSSWTGTKQNDFVYFDASVDNADGYAGGWYRAGPSMDGGGGADQLIFLEDGVRVFDSFFANLTSFEVVKLADGDGSRITLGDAAFAAGISEVNGGNGNDTIEAGKGDHIVRGGDGNDRLDLTFGDSDTVVFEATQASNGVDTIVSFNVGEVDSQRDVLDFFGKVDAVLAPGVVNLETGGVGDLMVDTTLTTVYKAIGWDLDPVYDGNDGLFGRNLEVYDGADAIVLLGQSNWDTTIQVYRVWDADASASIDGQYELLANVTLVGGNFGDLSQLNIA